MNITEIYKHSYNISTDDYEIEFFDCEEPGQGTYYDNQIYYDPLEEIPEPVIPFAEDIKRTLYHLIKIVTAYEADRLSISLLHNAGLGIPLFVLTAAHSFYRAYSRGENIGTLLVAGIPLFGQAILPHSGKLILLATYIKNHIEDQVGILNLPFTTGDGNLSESGYLGLGILALMGEYYFTRHPVPAPNRAGLKLPVVLAQLFARICQYWHILCASSMTDGAPPVDEFGRIVLSAGEKREQRLGRKLARLWTKELHPGQIQVERIAESYYGIEKPSGAVETTAWIKDQHHHHEVLSRLDTAAMPVASLSPLIAPVRRVMHTLGRRLISTLMPFPAASAATLNPSSHDMTPQPDEIIINNRFGGPHWITPYVRLNHYLRKSYPTITRILAQQMAEAIRRHVGIILNPDNYYLYRFDPPRSAPVSPTDLGPRERPENSLTLTEFALEKYFTQRFDDLSALDNDYGLYDGNRSAPDTDLRARLPFMPSDLVQHLDKQELSAIYRQELQHYWHGNREFHALANLITLLDALSNPRQRLRPQDMAMAMGALGFMAGGRHGVRISLFDINGYMATDLTVIEAQESQDILLYLPQARRPFRRFENNTAMRGWIIKQSRDVLGRQEIIDHFPLQDREDGVSIFGRWGVRHWLDAIADYPEHIWQKGEALTGVLYEILAGRQQARSLADTDYLSQLPRPLPGNKDDDTATRINRLYTFPMAPFTALAGMEDGAFSPRTRSPGRPTPQPRISDSAQLALSLSIAAAGEILPVDNNGDIHFPAGPKISLSLFQSIINYDMQATEMPHWGNKGEARLVNALSVIPAGYIRTHRRWPNGRIDMQFSITLTLSDGQRRENITAIRIFNKILPLRFNTQLQSYEVFDIHHEDQPGYPVCHNNKNNWQFGRLIGHDYHDRWAVSMAVYSNVSIRLYEKLIAHLNELCKSVADLTPANSLGVAQDANGADYLIIKNHYFKMIKTPEDGVFLVRGDSNIELKIKFDSKKKKFFYIANRDGGKAYHEKLILPGMLNTGINPLLSYRQGFRSSETKSCRRALAAEKSLVYSGLKKIIYYGLSEEEIALNPRYAPQATAVRKGFSFSDQILRELWSTREQLPLRDALLCALQITGADKSVQHRAWLLFLNNLKKMLTLSENHAGEGYHRVWGASFDHFTTAMVALKSDPLKRLWFNVRFRQQKGPHNYYQVQYCHYGCKEIPPLENIASVSRTVGKEIDPAGEILVNPVFKDDFPKIMSRLQAGNMSSNEINRLLGLSEAANVQHFAFLSDKTLAAKLFRTKATARFKMILTDAGGFSHLLLHLHATVNNRSCEHPYQDPISTVLLMLAWQVL